MEAFFFTEGSAEEALNRSSTLKDSPVSTYAKIAFGERLKYQPANLHKYAGEQFCLRITPEHMDLDRCFFVYLDERFEGYSIRKLLQTYIFMPGIEQEAEMTSWLNPWLRMDPMLPKKRMLLRQMAARVREHSGKVLFYINHGPAGPINPEDPVYSHLGTSVFSDGSFDDKILDVVLEFHADGEPLPELAQWARFDPVDTLGATKQGPGTGSNRRSILRNLIIGLVAILTLPFLLFSCNRLNNGNGGFGGGML